MELDYTHQIPSVKEETASVLETKPMPDPEEWLSQYEDRIASIPDSNGIRFYQRLDVRVGIICDEFFYDSICEAANFVYITPDNWEETVTKASIDVFLFVTAWRGLHEEWRGIGTLRSVIEKSYNLMRDTVFQIIDRCKEERIPTVFYSKEDPPNYELFLNFAKKCDYVFTTAQECIPYYQRNCQNASAQAVQFGINPRFHNPIGSYQKEKEHTVLFSGSWMKKYPKRCDEISVIFDGILASPYDLHIIDRNYGVEQYQYPDPYRASASPAVEHSKLQKLHKLFDWAVNVNSVTASETMFANRTFELQASGVLLLSNYSVGVNEIHPTVFMVNTSEDVTHILSGFTGEVRYERQLAGIRSVMTSHTCFDRISELLAPTGIDTSQPERRILVLCDQITERVRDSFARQTYTHKTLLSQSELTPSVLADFDMVTWFCSDSRYGEFYLEDMINGFKYTACDYITKDAWYQDGQLQDGLEHTYVSAMKSRFRTVFWRDAFSDAFFLTPPEAMELPNGYSIDHCSYQEGGTVREERTRPYLISVIVPIGAHGSHLYGKAFSSLLCSSLFSDLEILLVCDNEINDRTQAMLSYLQESYSNVRSIAVENSGNPVAAFLRSGGLAQATGSYIAFLNAENEAICDGYARLYEAAASSGCDIALGKQFNCDRDVRLQPESMEDIGLGMAFLSAAGFPKLSLQSMLFRRDFLKSRSDWLETASFFETLFCWRLLEAAEEIRTLDIPVCTTYLYRHSYKTDTFLRQLEDLKESIAWLNTQGLLSAFEGPGRGNQLESEWFSKLERAETREDCAPILLQALEQLEPWIRDPSPAVRSLRFYFRRGCNGDALDLLDALCPSFGKRPMPTLAELSKGSRKKRIFQIEYEKKERGILLRNAGEAPKNAMYAWVVQIKADNRYEKVFGSKYIKENTLEYDCTTLPAGSYKIRAFRTDADGGKISEDALFFSLSDQGEIIITET